MAELLTHLVTRADREDGTIILGSGRDTGPVVNDTNVWLQRWAQEAPSRVFLAERSGAGWRTVTYLEAWEQVRALAAGLLAHGIGPGQAIAVLSGPSVNHGLLMQAAQMIGALTVPLAEQYSLIPDAHARLRYCIEKAQPTMVYAESAQAFGPALSLPFLDGLEKVVTHGATDGMTPFDSLLNTAAGAEVDAAHAAIGPDTLAKILFTSGSTSDPKAVPTTQRMLTVNQAQYHACMPMLDERPHTILDWLPWNHVFGSNFNFNLMLANGGSMYLDGGKPVKGLFDETLENLRLIPQTLSFNVPVAYGLLAAAMRDDTDLRQAFFGDLDMIFYAGASLPAAIWTALEDLALAETGRKPLMATCWGMTETAPASILHYQGKGTQGAIGVPMPAQEAKLIPEQPGRYELRVRGPNIFTGYMGDPAKTAEAFDDEGFFVTGDAVRFVDPGDMAEGVLFDGRLSEEFKLQTGTWVQASQLRLDVLQHMAGLVQDVVVTGDGRTELGLLIFAAPPLGLTGDGTGSVSDAEYAGKIGAILADMAAEATGSSTRITRALVIDGPPSVGDGEITAKGSLNIKAILNRRADLLERLYDDADPAVIRA